MGESPRVKDDDKSWVRSRQFTGRIVTVTNDKVFDCPIYNTPTSSPTFSTRSVFLSTSSRISRKRR